jgi:hypothetical protein
MEMADLYIFDEANAQVFDALRLWAEKHLCLYGSQVPTEDGEFIIEFPMPAENSLCKPSEIPSSLDVNGVVFTKEEVMQIFEILNTSDELD